MTDLKKIKRMEIVKKKKKNTEKKKKEQITESCMKTTSANTLNNGGLELIGTLTHLSESTQPITHAQYWHLSLAENYHPQRWAT